MGPGSSGAHQSASEPPRHLRSPLGGQTPDPIDDFSDSEIQTPGSAPPPPGTSLLVPSGWSGSVERRPEVPRRLRRDSGEPPRALGPPSVHHKPVGPPGSTRINQNYRRTIRIIFSQPCRGSSICCTRFRKLTTCGGRDNAPRRSLRSSVRTLLM